MRKSNPDVNDAKTKTDASSSKNEKTGSYTGNGNQKLTKKEIQESGTDQTTKASDPRSRLQH